MRIYLCIRDILFETKSCIVASAFAVRICLRQTYQYEVRQWAENRSRTAFDGTLPCDMCWEAAGEEAHAVYLEIVLS